jgi:hypothetical protein
MTLGVFWLHGVHRIAGNPDASREDYAGPEGYTAEFTCLTEETRAVVDLRPDQVRPARGRSLGKPREAEPWTCSVPRVYGLVSWKKVFFSRRPRFKRDRSMSNTTVSMVQSVKDEIDLLDTFSESVPSSPRSTEAALESESDSVSISLDRSGR